MNNLDKVIKHFFDRIEFDDDRELVSIKDFNNNPFIEYSAFCTYETLETYIAGKIVWVLEHVYGLNKREVLEAGYKINNLIRDRLKNCELKGRYNFDTYMTDKEYQKSIDYNVNRHLNETDGRTKEQRNWYSILVDEIIDDKLLKDNGQSYNKINRNDPITHKELNFLRNKYQRKIIKHLISVSRIKPGIIGGTRLYFDDGSGYKPFSTTSMITEYVEDTFGEDHKNAYDLVFTYLRLVRIILDEENQSILKEQHYNDWDERSRERNINLLKSKGITVLSTDSNVPFYKRIDSKEIRYLKKIVDILDKGTKLVIEDDFSFIVFTPFGDFELDVLLNEHRHYGFEKFVESVYGVGDNQIIFPVHNSISQTRESQFLWEMYKDKLKRKRIQLVNPGFDIPDDAIIIEQYLSDDEHKSLLQSFEYMDMSSEMATEELGNLIRWVKDLPEELYLYRVLYLDDEDQINYDELGSHYSQDRTDLINNHYDRGSIFGHGQGEDGYLITVKAPKSEIDVMETLNNNILYPHEKEITLKDKGRGAQYLDIEKI